MKQLNLVEEGATLSHVLQILERDELQRPPSDQKEKTVTQEGSFLDSPESENAKKNSSKSRNTTASEASQSLRAAVLNGAEKRGKGASPMN